MPFEENGLAFWLGHLYPGRYKAVLVDKEPYLLEVGRYILLNPIRAHMVDNLEEYQWSSWQALMGKEEAPEWLAVNQTLLRFDSQLSKARRKYHDFVLSGIGKPLWVNLRQQVFLGSEDFINSHMESSNVIEGDIAEIPAKQRRPNALPIQEYAVKANTRDEAITAAFASGGLHSKTVR